VTQTLTPPTAELPAAEERPLASGAALLAFAVLAAFWGITVWRLGAFWSALPEYSYGWVVPLLCAMMFFDRWRTALRPQVPASSNYVSRLTFHASRFSMSAFCFLLAVLVCFVLARLALEVLPSWRFAAWTLALSVTILTLMLLRKFGFRISDFGFPTAFFLLSVPWPSGLEWGLIQGLTRLNAAFTVELLSFFKVAAVQMGNIILIEPGMVGVQEACSGIRSFQSTLMASLFLGELFRFGFWRRVVFVAAGACLSLFFNVVRTSFLVWTCNRDGLGAVDKFHDPAGWTILAASAAGLALIGWFLYRQQGRARHAVGAVPPATNESRSAIGNPQSAIPSTSIPASCSPSAVPSKFRFQLSSFSISLFLLAALLVTETGIQWWFTRQEKLYPRIQDWTTSFETHGESFKPLTITREVKGMLSYDRGGGWGWQGGGAERWQAFYFTWDPPKTLARKLVCYTAATVHKPEICFTAAGMQVRQFFGARRYVVNGVPLTFQVYEFNDRNIPIFVFSAIWHRNARDASGNFELRESPSTFEGIRLAAGYVLRGDRGITDEIRVLKLGVWGPRTLGEAEASFQRELQSLVHPK
jgi:exosortase